MMRNYFKKHGGFTLLEVIASAVILTIVATGAMSAWSRIQLSALTMRDKKMPLLIAERKIVELKSGYQKVSGSPVVPVTDPASLSDTGIEVPEVEGGRMWITVEHIKPVVTPEPSTGLKRVAVRVKWNPPGFSVLPTDCPKDRCIELKTYLYREG